MGVAEGKWEEVGQHSVAGLGFDGASFLVGRLCVSDPPEMLLNRESGGWGGAELAAQGRVGSWRQAPPRGLQRGAGLGAVEPGPRNDKFSAEQLQIFAVTLDRVWKRLCFLPWRYHLSCFEARDCRHELID